MKPAVLVRRGSQQSPLSNGLSKAPPRSTKVEQERGPGKVLFSPTRDPRLATHLAGRSPHPAVRAGHHGNGGRDTRFLSPLISLLPKATLAAVVVVTTLPLLGTTEFRAILRVRRTELLWSLASCAGVVLLGTLQGILVAVAISVLTLTYQANHPLVYAVRRKPGTEVFRPQSSDHPGDETVPGLLIVRTERPYDLRERTPRMFLDLGEAVQAYENRHRGRGYPRTPATPPDMRVRIRRFGELSRSVTTKEGRPREAK
jgi:hypothetical protein